MWAYVTSLFTPAQNNQVYGVAAALATQVSHDRAAQIIGMLDDRSRWAGHHKLYNLIDWTAPAFPGGPVRSPLYLGGVQSLQNRAFMSGIGAVVSVIDTERFPKQFLHEFVGKRPHLYLPLDDHPSADISKYFDESVDFIKYYQDRNVPVFVHCVVGKSRSATLVINYLMRKYGMTAIQATHLVKTRRPIIRPNDGFIAQLIRAEEK